MPGLRSAPEGWRVILLEGVSCGRVWLGVCGGGLHCGGGLCCERLCREGSGTVLEDPPVVGHESEGVAAVEGGTARGGVELEGRGVEGVPEGVA